MTVMREHEPGDPPGPTRMRIQRPDLDDTLEPVSAEWLSAVALREADAVDRMLQDADLVTSLELREFAGPWWEYFSNELAKYGLAVWRAWLATGVIYERCKQKGCAVTPLERAFTQDEIEDLAADTVARALCYFRDQVLMKHRWDPTKGASLRTFFIGACIFRFRNVYRDFVRGLAREPGLTSIDSDTPEHEPAEQKPGPESLAISQLEVQEALHSVRDVRVREAFLLVAQGHTQAEIADTLNTTVKTVERMLANERERQRKRRAS